MSYAAIEGFLILMSLIVLLLRRGLWRPSRVAFLVLIGFCMALMEIHFYKVGAWLYGSHALLGPVFAGLPIEEWIFCLLIFPLVPTSFWALSGRKQ